MTLSSQAYCYKQKMQFSLGTLAPKKAQVLNDIRVFIFAILPTLCIVPIW